MAGVNDDNQHQHQSVLVSTELCRSMCDVLSDINLFGTWVFERDRLWCRVIDPSARLMSEVSLGAAAFDLYNLRFIKGQCETYIFPIWFEEFKQTLEKQEKIYVAGVKQSRDREAEMAAKQGRQGDFDLWLKHEQERDKSKQVRVVLRVREDELLSHTRASSARIHAESGRYNNAPDQDVRTFPSDVLAMCDMDPMTTQLITTVDLTGRDVQPEVDPTRFQRWSVAYKVSDDFAPIPEPIRVTVPMFTHGLCISASALSNKLNNFPIITDHYVYATIDGNRLILSAEQDGKMTLEIEGRPMYPANIMNWSELREHAATSNTPADALTKCWDNTSPITHQLLLRHMLFASRAKSLAHVLYVLMSPTHGLLLHYAITGYGRAGNVEERDVYIRLHLSPKQ